MTYFSPAVHDTGVNIYKLNMGGHSICSLMTVLSSIWTKLMHCIDNIVTEYIEYSPLTACLCVLVLVLEQSAHHQHDGRQQHEHEGDHGHQARGEAGPIRCEQSSSLHQSELT